MNDIFNKFLNVWKLKKKTYKNEVHLFKKLVIEIENCSNKQKKEFEYYKKLKINSKMK